MRAKVLSERPLLLWKFLRCQEEGSLQNRGEKARSAPCSRGGRHPSADSGCGDVKEIDTSGHILSDVDDVRVNQAEAIEHAYRTNGDRLWRALLAYAGDPELASDSLAETLARALASSTSIDDAAAWLWRVGFRVATAELKAARKPDPEQEATYELDEEVLGVLIALNRLTDRQRATFVLFYLDDRPTEEIATVLGMSSSTVSVHLHRARRRLRAILEADDA